MANLLVKGLIGEEDIHKYDGTNTSFTRATSTGGTNTLTPVGAGAGGWSFAAILVKNLEGVLYADQFTGADIGAKINAAHAALPANGGTIRIPAGTYIFSTQIAITKTVRLIGAGAMETTSQSPTLLTWNGAASAAIKITGGNAANTIIEKFGLSNSGSGTIGIDLDGDATGNLDEVTIRDVVISGFSSIGIRAGNTAAHFVAGLTLEHVVIRNQPTNLQILQTTDVFIHRCEIIFPGANNLNVQIGDSTHAAFSVRFIGCDIEPGAGSGNATDVSILNGESVSFDHCYFESDGTGYTINIPNTATKAQNIAISNCRFKGASAGNSTTYANNVNLSTATISIRDCYMALFANPGYCLRNDAALLSSIIGLVTDATTSLGFLNASNSDVSYDTLKFGATGASGKRLSGKLLVRASAAEAGDVDISGKVTSYNGATTVSGGIPAELATVDLTAQTAPVSATTIFTPSADGMFRISAYLKITTTGTSPVLGPVTITYTDADGVAQSVVMAQQLQTGAMSNTGNNGNSTTSVLTGSLVIFAKASVAIQYAIALTGTVGAAQYEAHLKCEAL